MAKTPRPDIGTIVSETESTVAPTIVHMSDVHFGPRDHNFLFPPDTPSLGGPEVDLATALRRDVQHVMKEPPGLLVISGDITSGADWEPTFRDRAVVALRKVADELGVSRERIILTPGNHDFKRPKVNQPTDGAKITVANAVRYEHEDQFRIFRLDFVGREHKASLSGCFTFPSKGFAFRIGVLNSANLAATKFAEYGYVGSAPMSEVMEAISKPGPPSIRILVLHHHLVPISPVEVPQDNGVSLTLDAHDVLKRAQEAGVQLILHGHQHEPKVVKLAFGYGTSSGFRWLDGEDVYILAGGSAGSCQLRNGMTNTYTILRVIPDGIEVTCRRIDARNTDLGNLFSTVLPIRPR